MKMLTKNTITDPKHLGFIQPQNKHWRQYVMLRQIESIGYGAVFHWAFWKPAL